MLHGRMGGDVSRVHCVCQDLELMCHLDLCTPIHLWSRDLSLNYACVLALDSSHVDFSEGETLKMSRSIMAPRQGAVLLFLLISNKNKYV